MTWNYITKNNVETLLLRSKLNILKIDILSNEHFSPPEYIINFQSKTKKIIEKLEKIIELKKNVPKPKEELNYIKNKNRKDKNKRKKFFKKKFYKKN